MTIITNYTNEFSLGKINEMATALWANNSVTLCVGNSTVALRFDDANSTLYGERTIDNVFSEAIEYVGAYTNMELFDKVLMAIRYLLSDEWEG